MRRWARPAPDETIAKAKKADAVLFGAVGGPQWDTLPFDQKPERGTAAAAQGSRAVRQSAPGDLLRCTEGRVSSLKPEIVSGLDILIVRELTGGVYFGEPKEITTLPDGQKRAVDTQVYTTQRDRAHRARGVRTGAAARQARGVGREDPT